MDALTSGLWSALSLGQYDLANRLIRLGANVNAPRQIEFEKTTLLHYEAALGKVQSLRLLINHNANCNARDSLGRTPLHCALHRGGGDRSDIVEVLINAGAVVDAQDFSGKTPLHRAVSKKLNELAQQLIARGASINEIDGAGRSVLHTAVLWSNLEMVRMLISQGVNIDAKDKTGCTPLHAYVMRSNYACNMDIIQLLLENGADVNTRCKRGCFPLFKAVRWNSRVLLFLLKWGARVNDVTIIGETALHEACLNTDTESVALLLNFGADLNVRDEEGVTPFDLLINSPSCEATAKVVIREAVKREALGQSLCEEYKQMAQSCETYSRFEEECREEIERMQSEKIDTEDSAISFFYILSMDEEKLAALARNESIVTAFESSGYVASFGIYTGELMTKFEVAKLRANFIMSVEDCLLDALGDIPAAIVKKIAAYVKSGDIMLDELSHDCD